MTTAPKIESRDLTIEKVYEEVAPNIRESLALAGLDLTLRWIDPRHAPYLQYHRAHVFRGTDRVAEAALPLPKE